MASSTSNPVAQPNGAANKIDARNGVAKDRPRRPNYKLIHRFPLPLTVHPLPPLIPHNPLSVISIALSYLTFFISPPPRQEVHSAYFDASTSSIHVTDAKTIRALWEMGFFGKGSLSRSEPSWVEREKKRLGLLGVNTSEEATKMRRVERREFKLERARKEQEAIADRLRAESKDVNGTTTAVTDISSDSVKDSQNNENRALNKESKTESELHESISPLKEEEKARVNGRETPSGNGTKSVRFSSTVDELKPMESQTVPDNQRHTPSINHEEHLQLSNEEAFFLAYGLGILQIYDDTRTSILRPSSLLSLFRQHSYFPPREPSALAEPDDRFIVSYVAYHHFRSLGWVVRSGVKFGVDLLLYNRGPVFSHAEFAVALLPSYSHPYWQETEERRSMVAKKRNHTWWWLHCVNRVQAHVKKSLILCYVEIPPPSGQTLHDASGAEEPDIGALLKTYKVRELAIKRWVPNRSRD